jgi:aryl-alcohol dehydrogenase-like predicted oxidoreductase
MGASKIQQIDEAVSALSKLDFSRDELREIERLLE